jgi:hypothetical protein
MKHLEHTFKIYMYNNCNSATSRSTFATSIYSTCSLHLKHHKHLKHTLATWAFSKTYQAGKRSTAQRDPMLGHGEEGGWQWAGGLRGPLVGGGTTPGERRAPGERHPQWMWQQRSGRCGLARWGTPRWKRSRRAGVVPTARCPHVVEGRGKRQSRWRRWAVGEQWGNAAMAVRVRKNNNIIIIWKIIIPLLINVGLNNNNIIIIWKIIHFSKLNSPIGSNLIMKLTSVSTQRKNLYNSHNNLFQKH